MVWLLQAQGIEVIKAADLRANDKHIPGGCTAALTPRPARKKCKRVQAEEQATAGEGSEQQAAQVSEQLSQGSEQHVAQPQA